MEERLVISLIGMSGSGKSHWSKELQGKGFERYCCDDLIEERLGGELKALGYSGIQDVARWMGQPFHPQYGKTSRRYLDFEGEVTGEAMAKVEQSKSPRVVIDTTGSVIYLEERTLDMLSRLTKVVYLETPEDVQEEMYRLYLADPKPVIWGDIFSRADGETDIEALSRCYPKLLAYRLKKYKGLAHFTLDYHQLRRPDFNVDNFLELLSQ